MNDVKKKFFKGMKDYSRAGLSDELAPEEELPLDLGAEGEAGELPPEDLGGELDPLAEDPLAEGDLGLDGLDEGADLGGELTPDEIEQIRLLLEDQALV